MTNYPNWSGPALRTYKTASGAVVTRRIEPRSKKVMIENIQRLVAAHFEVTKADIVSHRRTGRVVRPRQIAMYLSKVLTLRSLPEIGRQFSRDHTTILHAVRKIGGLIEADAALAAEIAALREMLSG